MLEGGNYTASKAMRGGCVGVRPFRMLGGRVGASSFRMLGGRFGATLFRMPEGRAGASSLRMLGRRVGTSSLRMLGRRVGASSLRMLRKRAGTFTRNARSSVLEEVAGICGWSRLQDIQSDRDSWRLHTNQIAGVLCLATSNKLRVDK